jgi:phenylacetate-CoA ligase
VASQEIGAVSLVLAGGSEERLAMSGYDELITKQRGEVADGLLGSARRLRWSADRLATERQRQLRELLVWSAQHSSFWRDRLAGHDLTAFTEGDLPSLPVLTKAEMMANFDRAVTVPGLTLARAQDHIDRLRSDSYFDGTYRVVATSGSSGRRGVLVYNWHEWNTLVLGATRWRGRTAERLTTSVATLYASNAKHVSGALHAFSRDFSGDGAVPVTHLPATLPLPQIVAGLERAQPGTLQGYPSSLHLLAVEATSGRLHIAPTWVASCGEQCSDAARDAVRAAWGVEIQDQWGCSEGIYAATCSAGEGMHLPDDLAIIEPVDRDYRPVAAGQPADRILVTRLYNRTQPLIRYEMTDSMTIVDDVCACGCAHRRMTDLRGRSDDSYFHYEGGAAVHAVGIEAILLSDPDVLETQVTQTPKGARVTMVSRERADIEATRARLLQFMAQSGVIGAEVTVSQVTALDRLWSGKLRPFEPLAVEAPLPV